MRWAICTSRLCGFTSQKVSIKLQLKNRRLARHYDLNHETDKYMRILVKILFTVLIVIPVAYYFISLNIDAFATDQIKGRYGLVYGKWSYMFYFAVAYNFAFAALFLFIPVLLFVPKEKLNNAKNKIKEFLRKL